MKMGAAEWGMLLALSTLWGGSFFFVEIAIKDLPPLTVVFLRVALGAAVLWGVALITGPDGRKRRRSGRRSSEWGF